MLQTLKPDWVSVVIPTYNRADRLPESIKSCLTQTHRQVEVLVVDDGSTDHTPDILPQLTKVWGAERLRWVRQAHQGACTARNTGMAMAHGEFLQFLDSDDRLHSQKFEQQVEALKQSVFPVAVSDFQVVTESGNNPVHVITSQGDLRKKITTFQSLWTASPLFRTTSIPPSLVWCPLLTRNQEQDFQFRYFLGIPGWVYTPGVGAYYVQHTESRISDANVKRPQYEELFHSAYNYWLTHSQHIPPANHWMIPQFLLSLARVAIGERKQLTRRMLLLAMCMKPYRWNRILLAGLLFSVSYCPNLLPIRRFGGKMIRRIQNSRCR